MKRIGSIRVTILYRHGMEFLRSEIVDVFNKSIKEVLASGYLEKEKINKVIGQKSDIEFRIKDERLMQVFLNLEIRMEAEEPGEILKARLSDVARELELKGIFLGYTNLMYDSHLVEVEIFSYDKVLE